MAYVIERCDLDESKIRAIRKFLTIVPVSKNQRYATAKDPIRFYLSQGEKVRLPYLFATGLMQKIPDLSYPPVEWKFTGELKEEQVSVDEEAWRQLSAFGTSTLSLHPGFGKTILGASLSSRAKLLTVVLVHREILAKQWACTFRDFTDARVWTIGEKNPPSEYDVVICVDQRYRNLSEEVRRKVGFLIIDEAHSFCTPGHVECLLSFEPKYVLAESATLEREDGTHTMMQAICGKHEVKRELSRTFKVIKYRTGVKPERKQNTMGGVDWSALVRSSLFDEIRNGKILSLVREYSEKKILILTSIIAHAELLHERIVGSGDSSSILCSNRKSYSDARVLVGTTSKIGTGFDQATACEDYSGRRFDLLILACSFKKEASLVQNVGRVLRADSPTVIYLVDDDSILESHWKVCKRWFVSQKATVTEK